MSQSRSRHSAPRPALDSPAPRTGRLRLPFWRRRDQSHRDHAVLVRSSHDQDSLVRAIEYHTDWTPFDLVQTTEREAGESSSRFAVCVFRYTGPTSQRTRFRENLDLVLQRVGKARALKRIPGKAGNRQ